MSWQLSLDSCHRCYNAQGQQTGQLALYITTFLFLVRLLLVCVPCWSAVSAALIMYHEVNLIVC